MKNNFVNNDKNSAFRHPDNANKINESSIAGIQRIVDLTYVIEGERAMRHFKNFKLLQNTISHHEFELVVTYDTFRETQNHNLEEVQKFLGRRFTATFSYKDLDDDSPERTFVGVITQVAFEQKHGNLGDIILKGKSPTVLLDAAPHTQSFGGEMPVNTSIIAHEIIKQGLGVSKFDVRVANQYLGSIDYSSQYNETHYNYLSRLAHAYGEQFFYDGEVLHFGSLPSVGKVIQLKYGSSFSEISVELNAIHTQPQFFSYISSNHEKITASDSNVRHFGDLAQKSLDINQNIFKTQSLSAAPINARMFKDVTDSHKSATGSSVVNVLSVSGNSTIPFLFPGCVVDVEMRQPDTNKTSYFTRLMITVANHELDGRGFYKGSFEAIAGVQVFYQNLNFLFQKPSSR